MSFVTILLNCSIAFSFDIFFAHGAVNYFQQKTNFRQMAIHLVKLENL